jgi:starch synthase
MDHKVTVISPLWSGIDPATHALARKLSTIGVKLGAREEQLTVFDGRTTGGVDLVFIGHDELLSGEPPDSSRPASPKHVLAAAAFAQAAIAVVQERCEDIAVVHAHGWFAAPGLVEARDKLEGARRVLSLHDPAALGTIGAESRDALSPALLELAGDGADAGLLVAGARAADCVVASSQTAAAALAEDHPQVAAAIEPADKLVGIASALDAARWNPLTDMLIPARFDPVDLTGKQRCKDALQLELGLAVRPEVPVLFAVADAGTAQLLPLLDKVLRNDVQLIVQGAEGETLERLDALAEEHTERLALMEASEGGLHRGVAAADGLIVTGDSPQTAELHLSGQCYGALPVAPAVGAIADGVVDCDANLQTGNGFLYPLGDAGAMLSAIQRLLAAYSDSDGWARLRTRAMGLDLSWDRVARRYEHCYR